MQPLLARKYWNKLKERPRKEGRQLVTNCHQLKTLDRVGRTLLSADVDVDVDFASGCCLCIEDQAQRLHQLQLRCTRLSALHVHVGATHNHG
jgi:hypothetical protein